MKNSNLSRQDEIAMRYVEAFIAKGTFGREGGGEELKKDLDALTNIAILCAKRFIERSDKSE